MDPAQEFITAALRHQKPMNNVIDRGDSPVQQFYKDAIVLLMGGSGFIGKQLIEKLFRSCAIKKMYLLLRPEKGRTVGERLQMILSDPVFDLLRKKQPHFADKVVPIEGDLADVKLGISDKDWTTLTQEVTSIFNAATTRFDESLRMATLVNVRVTRDSLILAKACLGLQSYVYISACTKASKNNINKVVNEDFYPSPLSPEVLISLVEELDEDVLNSIASTFIHGWPNTYAFTKAVAEELIRTTSKDLPICIMRPPIVLHAYYEPSPGWLDENAVIGPSGIALAPCLGIPHVYRFDKNATIPAIPVDYVNNAVIAAGWDAQQRRLAGDKDIPIYNLCDKDYEISSDLMFKHIAGNVRLASDKAVYVCAIIQCNNRHLYGILSTLLHYIPSYILDAGCAVVGKRPTGIKSSMKIHSEIDKLQKIYDFYTSNHRCFHGDNVKAMLERMSEADRAIYNCDLSTINIPEYLTLWQLGLRKFIIKDGLHKTHLGYKKQRVYKTINYLLLTLYVYMVIYLSMPMITIVKDKLLLFRRTNKLFYFLYNRSNDHRILEGNNNRLYTLTRYVDILGSFGSWQI